MMLPGKILLIISALVLVVIGICWPTGEVNLHAELDKMLRILNPERPEVHIPESAVAVGALVWGQFMLMWSIMCYFNRHPLGHASGPQCYAKPSIFMVLASLLMFSLMQDTAPWAFGALAVYGLMICARQASANVDSDVRKMIE